MQHNLSVGSNLVIPVKAREPYSEEHLAVAPGQQYKISCEGEQYWKDWFYKTTAEGYHHPLSKIARTRVPKANCFCLCGAYNKNIKTGFAIGLTSVITVPGAGYSALFFFANDFKGFYWNNFGQLVISVSRIA